MVGQKSLTDTRVTERLPSPKTTPNGGKRGQTRRLRPGPRSLFGEVSLVMMDKQLLGIHSPTLFLLCQ